MGQSVSLTFFLLAIALYAGGALASLAAGRSQTANGIGSWSAVSGSLAGLVALLTNWSGPAILFSCDSQLPLGMLRIAIDPLSRLFLLPVFLLTALCALYGARYLKGWQGRRNLGAHWFFLNLLAAGMALVPVVDDGFLFLIVWEFMSLTPFFLVAFEDDKADVREASWVYLVAAHLGAFFLLAAFALLSGQAESFSFDAFRVAAPDLPPATAAIVFILALVGFGAKAGFAPLHIWLPEAHPAAPSHVSALMSGAMVNAGIYGLCRTFEFLGPVQSWQGPLLLGIGLATALYGVLAALVQKKPETASGAEHGGKYGHCRHGSGSRANRALLEQSESRYPRICGRPAARSEPFVFQRLAVSCRRGRTQGHRNRLPERPGRTCQKNARHGRVFCRWCGCYFRLAALQRLCGRIRAVPFAGQRL